MALFTFGLELLLATLLWGMAMVGWYSHRRNWKRLTASFLVCVGLIIPWLILFALILIFYLPNPERSSSVWFVAIASIAAFLGLGIIWFGGLRLKSNDGQVIATRWPLRSLVISAFVVTVLAKITLWTFDAYYQQRLTESQREAQILADSVAPRPVIDEDNAAPLYYQVFDAFGALARPQQSDFDGRPKRDTAPEEPNAPAFNTFFWVDIAKYALDNVKSEKDPYDFRSSRLKAFLDRQIGVRELIIRASKKPACYFGHDYVRPSFDTLLPELDNLRRVEEFLIVDARHAAAIGDYKRAAENLEASYRLAAQIKEEPYLVSFLVSLAIQRSTESTLRVVLEEAVSPPNEILQMQIPAQMPMLVDIDRCTRFEEASMIYSIGEIGFDFNQAANFISLTSDVPSHGWLLKVFYAPFARAFFVDAVTNDLRRGYREIWQPRPNESINEGKWNSYKDAARDAQTTIVRAVLPAIGNCNQAAIRGEILQRQVRVALGLYRYYHGNGEDGQPRKKFPATLAELVPAYLDFVPSDPFNNNLPMSYRVTDRGSVVYSIGPDGKDEGGLAAKEGEGRDDHDFVFECLTPAEPTFPKPEPAK